MFGLPFFSRFVQQHSFYLSVCAVALLVELWFPSVILLFILTFNVFPICENLHCSDATWLFISTVYFHLLETTSFKCNFTFYIEAWCIFDFAYTFDLLCYAYILHPFSKFWYTFGLLVVYFRVTFGTVFGFNTCLCCILYCIALCNHHNAIVSLPLYEAFYILDLLYVGFDYSYVLVYGSSSSNSLSSFFCLAQYFTPYFWYTFIPWKYTIASYNFNFVYIFKYFWILFNIFGFFLSHIIIYFLIPLYLFVH